MSKIKIKVTIKNEQETSFETMAIADDEKLKYKEDETTTVIWNKKENTLYRETKEIRIRYPFDKKKKTDGTLQVKGSLLEIMLPIKTLKLERKNHNIDLKYQVDGNTIEYCVEEIK